MTVEGPPSFTAVSKAVRYSSRRVRWSITLSELKRESSWELAAKCLRLEPTPWMKPAASLPAR